jgi:rSAM/selenodomain-associated transferase 2
VVSVIIPLYNEETILLRRSIYFQTLCQETEVIFVDGESKDRSVEISRRWAEVLETKKGRSVQMNYGARAAGGSILLFLHADTLIQPEALISIDRAVNSGFVGGCLSQRIDSKGCAYRFIENFGNTRARLTKVFYGDQGIFVRKDIFLKLGGFPEVSIMEDVLFTERLRRVGRTIVLPDKIIASARRWDEKGIIKTVLLYSSINILFRLKVSLKKIRPLYDDLR